MVLVWLLRWCDAYWLWMVSRVHDGPAVTDEGYHLRSKEMNKRSIGLHNLCSPSGTSKQALIMRGHVRFTLCWCLFDRPLFSVWVTASLLLCEYFINRPMSVRPLSLADANALAFVSGWWLMSRYYLWLMANVMAFIDGWWFPFNDLCWRVMDCVYVNDFMSLFMPDGWWSLFLFYS